MATPAQAVDTRKVANRRQLRFESLDEVLAEAQRIADAAHAGNLQQLGNWTPGQTFGHLAAWIHYGFDGYPMKPPWFIVIMTRLFKNKFLRGRLEPGVRIPKITNGTLATDPLPLDEGLDRLVRAIDRLKAAAPDRPNPLFGKLTHEEWMTLHKRHAELHFSFLVPTTPPA